MELTGVEPVSALSSNTPLVHRLSPSILRAGTATYPGRWDALARSLPNYSPEETIWRIRWGLVHSP